MSSKPLDWNSRIERVQEICHHNDFVLVFRFDAPNAIWESEVKKAPDLLIGDSFGDTFEGMLQGLEDLLDV